VAAASETVTAAATVNPSAGSPMPIYSDQHPASVSVADFKAAIWRGRVAAVRRDALRPGYDASARPPGGLKCIADIVVR